MLYLDDMTFQIQIFFSIFAVIVSAWLAYNFALRTKNYNALVEAKIRHYEKIAPLLNKIFRYRQKIGDYRDVSPEEILKTKRAADEEFHIHVYIWSRDFHDAYHRFIDVSFKPYEPPRALIRAEAEHYPRVTLSGWKGFTGEVVDMKENELAYANLMAAIAADLPFARPNHIRNSFVKTSSRRRAPLERL